MEIQLCLKLRVYANDKKFLVIIHVAFFVPKLLNQTKPSGTGAEGFKQGEV